jgi:hypothetical protein
MIKKIIHRVHEEFLIFIYFGSIKQIWKIAFEHKLYFVKTIARWIIFLITQCYKVNFSFSLTSPHWNVIFGLITLLTSYAYHSYCCVAFYSYYPTILAIFCLAQAAVPWHFREKSIARQIFSVIGAGLSTALVAITSFGFFCWANRLVC